MLQNKQEEVREKERICVEGIFPYSRKFLSQETACRLFYDEEIMAPL